MPIDFDAQCRHVLQRHDVEDDEIDTVGHQHRQHRRPFPLQQLQPDRRIGVDQVRGGRLHRDVMNVGARGDTQAAATAVAHDLELVRNRLGACHQLVGHLEHVVARRRRHDVAARPFEDLHAELLLEGGDVAAEGRLADTEGRGRSAEMAMASENDGVLQQFQIDIHADNVSSDRLPRIDYCLITAVVRGGAPAPSARRTGATMKAAILAAILIGMTATAAQAQDAPAAAPRLNFVWSHPLTTSRDAAVSTAPSRV